MWWHRTALGGGGRPLWMSVRATICEPLARDDFTSPVPWPPAPMSAIWMRSFGGRLASCAISGAAKADPAAAVRKCLREVDMLPTAYFLEASDLESDLEELSVL